MLSAKMLHPRGAEGSKRIAGLIPWVPSQGGYFPADALLVWLQNWGDLAQHYVPPPAALNAHIGVPGLTTDWVATNLRACLLQSGQYRCVPIDVDIAV